MSPNERIVVIARFSILKSLPTLLAGLSLLYPLYLPFFNQAPVAYLKERSQWATFVIIGWIAGVAFFMLLLLLGFQLLTTNRSAIWLDGDNLIYLNQHFLKVDKRNLREIVEGEFAILGMRFRIIRLICRDGRERSFSTVLFSDAHLNVLKNLKEALRLQ